MDSDIRNGNPEKKHDQLQKELEYLHNKKSSAVSSMEKQRTQLYLELLISWRVIDILTRIPIFRSWRKDKNTHTEVKRWSRNPWQQSGTKKFFFTLSRCRQRSPIRSSDSEIPWYRRIHVELFLVRSKSPLPRYHGNDQCTLNIRILRFRRVDALIPFVSNVLCQRTLSKSKVVIPHDDVQMICSKMELSLLVEAVDFMK